MPLFRLLFFIFFTSQLFANQIVLDNKKEYIELLSKSEIYVDKTRKLTINEIKNANFKKNDKSSLSYGYSPNLDVWIKFTLKNNTNEPIERILEYANALTTSIYFFNSTVEHDGLFYTPKQRKTVNSFFKIKLNPKQTKTYYIKASSNITTLIVKVNLWKNTSFFKKEIKHQVVLALFFGAMFILGIYNLFIFFFTKDISYFFYVLYILGIIIHQIFYVGIGNIYLFNEKWTIFAIENASIIVAFPIFSLALFIKSFLPLKTTPRLNKILSIFIFLDIFYVLVIMLNSELTKYRNFFSVLLLSYLIFLTIYFVYKKNREAYFILFGWLFIFTALLLMFLSSLGIFNIFDYFNYLIELSLILEAIIFSIALADKINRLQKEKDEANEQLLIQKQNETTRLSQKVEEKTKDLKATLKEKEVLLKELNHRVKNNMQTIVSLIRLQSDDIEDEKLQNVLLTIQNRINAMSHLHELLYKQENISHINTYEYFEILVEEVKDSYYDNDINISLNIKENLKVEHAIYCGLIVNELLTNSFKYAFPNKKGEIYIHLEKFGKEIELLIKDNGIGYDNTTQKDSLGLTLVNTLVKHQLKGDIFIKSNDGVQTLIVWEDKDEG